MVLHGPNFYGWASAVYHTLSGRGDAQIFDVTDTNGDIVNILQKPFKTSLSYIAGSYANKIKDNDDAMVHEPADFRRLKVKRKNNLFGLVLTLSLQIQKEVETMKNTIKEDALLLVWHLYTNYFYWLEEDRVQLNVRMQGLDIFATPGCNPFAFNSKIRGMRQRFFGLKVEVHLLEETAKSQFIILVKVPEIGLAVSTLANITI